MKHPLVVTIILNHPRGWGGKPTGSHEDSRVAEISQRFGPGFLFFRPGQKGEGKYAQLSVMNQGGLFKKLVRGDTHV
jgi:hypothetical protein